MVSELESFPESWGPKSTVLFVNDFLLFEQDSNNEGGLAEEEETVNSTAVTRFDADDLPYFLKWPEYVSLLLVKVFFNINMFLGLLERIRQVAYPTVSFFYSLY